MTNDLIIKPMMSQRQAYKLDKLKKKLVVQN